MRPVVLCRSQLHHRTDVAQCRHASQSYHVQHLVSAASCSAMLTAMITCSPPSMAAPPTTLACSPSAAVHLPPIASLFDALNGDRDPVEPFTLFGTTAKKYLIEQLDGEKVVSRRKGFTVQTCVAGYSSSEESPELNGAATRDKVYASSRKVCRKTEGDELKGTCATSCRAACAAGLARYSADADSFSGFKLPEGDKERVLRSCTRSCSYECTKPGKVCTVAAPTHVCCVLLPICGANSSLLLAPNRHLIS